jgi:hypothetical protein
LSKFFRVNAGVYFLKQKERLKNMPINGTPGNDNILGTPAGDVIVALAGNDLINAGNGNDTVDAGDGNDTVNAGNGDDAVDGGLGDDTLSGGNGNDTLDGGEGDDALSGGNGNDLMDGGAGSDNLEGGNGNDILVYVAAENGDSSDVYAGGNGSDTLRVVLTGAEWGQVDLRADLLRYLDALHSGDRSPFQFSALGLKATGFENVEVIVDGVPVVLSDHAVDAIDDAITVDEDSSIGGNVTGNDSVPDLVANVSLVQDVTQGALTLNGDGSFVFNTNGQFDYLAVGESAAQTFQYKVEDSNGDTDIATATITIEGVNDGPEANDDAASVSEDGPGIIIINLLANDTDPDASDTLSLDSLDLTGLQGTVVDNGDGTVTYNPNGAFDALNNGETAIDSFSYTISDGNGGTSTAAVAVTVAGQDDGLEGVTLDYTYIFPDAGSVYFNTDLVVGPGVELPGVYSGSFSDVASMDIEGDKVTFDFYANTFWTPAEFNGFRLFDEFDQVSDLTNVSIESNNMAGLSDANISFDANSFSVNWQGLSFDENTQVVFDLDFA